MAGEGYSELLPSDLAARFLAGEDGEQSRRNRLALAQAEHERLLGLLKAAGVGSSGQSGDDEQGHDFSEREPRQIREYPDKPADMRFIIDPDTNSVDFPVTTRSGEAEVWQVPTQLPGWENYWYLARSGTHPDSWPPEYQDAINAYAQGNLRQGLNPFGEEMEPGEGPIPGQYQSGGVVPQFGGGNMNGISMGQPRRPRPNMMQPAIGMKAAVPTIPYPSAPPSGITMGGSTDTVPAMLTPGEGVLNTGAMSMIGEPAVNALNQAGKGISMQGYAEGGTVEDDGKYQNPYPTFEETQGWTVEDWERWRRRHPRFEPSATPTPAPEYLGGGTGRVGGRGGGGHDFSGYDFTDFSGMGAPRGGAPHVGFYGGTDANPQYWMDPKSERGGLAPGGMRLGPFGAFNPMNAGPTSQALYGGPANAFAKRWLDKMYPGRGYSQSSNLAEGGIVEPAEGLAFGGVAGSGAPTRNVIGTGVGTISNAFVPGLGFITSPIARWLVGKIQSGQFTSPRFPLAPNATPPTDTPPGGAPDAAPPELGGGGNYGWGLSSPLSGAGGPSQTELGLYGGGPSGMNPYGGYRRPFLDKVFPGRGNPSSANLEGGGIVEELAKGGIAGREGRSNVGFGTQPTFGHPFQGPTQLPTWWQDRGDTGFAVPSAVGNYDNPGLSSMSGWGVPGGGTFMGGTLGDYVRQLGKFAPTGKQEGGVIEPHPIGYVDPIKEQEWQKIIAMLPPNVDVAALRKQAESSGISPQALAGIASMFTGGMGGGGGDAAAVSSLGAAFGGGV